MNKTLIVSSADSKYSQLLIELYKSVEGIDGFDFAVLDCGLSENSKIFFNQRGISYKIPDWEFKVPNYKVRGRDHLKIQFSRFYLKPDTKRKRNNFRFKIQIFKVPKSYHQSLFFRLMILPSS